MSILHLLGAAGDGGAETYFVELVGALQRAGLPQAAAIRKHAERKAQLRAAGAPVAEAMFGGPLDLFTEGRLAGFAREQGAKAVVAWMKRAARHAPKGPWARIGRLGGYYDLKYFKGFDVLVANTRDIESWILRQGWPESRLTYIPNFAAAPPGGVTPVTRESLGTPEGAPLLLGLGRLHQAKAHDVSLTALTRLPEAWLWIAGSGPLEAQLKAQAMALGVGERVRFLGWRTDAPALYAAADVCVFPSRFEPLGNVVIQAWAHGLPVVAAKSQGPAALIRHEEDGLLIPVDDAEALAEGVSRLLADRTLGARLAAAGRARVAAEFSEAAVVDQWRALLAANGAA